MGIQMENSKVICTLNDSDFQQRRQGLLAEVQHLVQGQKELDNGFAFQFSPSDEVIEMLSTLIRLERSCCAFLNFQLEVPAENGPIWLRLTGPDGSKSFLQGIFANS